MSSNKIDNIISSLDENQIDDLLDKLSIIKNKKRKELTEEFINTYIEELVDLFSKTQSIHFEKMCSIKVDICVDRMYIDINDLKEKLEKEYINQIAELKDNYNKYMDFSSKIANKLNVKANDLRAFVSNKYCEINKEK